MKLVTLLVTLAICVLLLWIGWTYKEAQIEEPAYTVLKKTNTYEIRQYQPYLIATVQVTGQYTPAQYKAFRLLADYIFGNNTTQTKMAMTAPVIGEKLADSLNQLLQSTEQEGDTYKVSFVMPEKYTLETLPKPINEQVVITQVPGQTVAVQRFSGYVSHNKIMQKTKELKEALENDGYTIMSSAHIARYNPPFAFPLMMRNEIMFVVQPA